MKKNYTCSQFPPEKWGKICRIMKLKLIILLCITSNLSASPIYSQTERFDVSFKKQNITAVIDQLKTLTGYQFFYRKGILAEDTKISASFTHATLAQILDKVLSDNGYQYEINDNVVLIKPAETKSTQTPPKSFTLKGRVTDSQGVPIVGASVVVEKSTIGTSADSQGEFSLKVTAPTGRLIVSFVGYQTVTVAYDVKKTISIVMSPSVSEIDEVVVTGIFNRPKESFTGSVTSISAKDLKTFRGQNVLATLRNIDPSINIAYDNLSGSNPNREYEITIRGNSSLPVKLDELESTQGRQLNAPLVIMDGFEISLQKLMDFNDEEIESINILKDASATAIYGSRGANGVIVIQTRSPKAGKLKLFAQVGFNLEIPDLSSYNLMNAVDKLTLEKKVGLYDSSNPYTSLRLTELYNKRLTDALQGETEWIREPVRVGVGQKLNLRMEGGSDQFRWSVSAGNNLINGAMKGSKRGTSNASITLHYNYKNLIFRNVSSFEYTKSDNGSYGSFSDYAILNPYFRAKNEQGKLIKTWEALDGSDISNPLADAMLDVKNYTKTTNIRNVFSIDWKINEAFNAKGQIGISKDFTTTDYYLPAEHSSFIRTNDFFAKGLYNYTTGEGVALEANLTLSYSKIFNEKHALYAGLYGIITKDESFRYLIKTQGLLNSNFNDFSNALDYKEGTVPSGTDSKTASVGLTGSINYTYDSRYYIDGSFRVDGSSQFGSKRRYAPFWSAGIGWNLHNEAFLKEQSLVNTLRLRLSAGQTGSQQFSAYQANSMYGFTTDSRYLYWTSAELLGLGNKNLTWQTTTQYNAGADIELFSGRVTGGLDVFYKKTTDLLSAIDIKQVHGFKSYTENVGSTKNYGFESMLGSYIVRNTKRGILWHVSGKLTYTINKVISLSDDIKRQVQQMRVSSEYGRLLYEGRSQNAIYAVKSLGIDPIDGQELFLDNDGNVTKTWNAAYRVYCGNAEPTYRGSLNSLFTWRDLSLNLSFAYHWGGKQYNKTLLDKVEVQTHGYTAQSGMKSNVDYRVSSDRWQKPGDVKFFKGYSNDETHSSTRFVMDDNVFQLQSVSVQYRWNSPFVKKYLHAEAFNISLNMSDLFYVSSIKRERGLNYPFANNVQLALSIIF